jgi:opacity protein-like surface antigen
MIKKTILTLLVVFSLAEISMAQNYDGLHLGSGYSITPSVVYVSAATIQLSANSQDLFERSLTEELSGGYGYGIAIRKKLFDDDLSFGISTEFLKIYDDELSQSFFDETTRARVRVTEELWMVPIEFTGYFNIPQFTDNIEIYLGGGLGVYFGDRVRTVLNVKSETISKESNFSFVILSGMEVLLSKQLAAVFEMRFRQGEYQVQSKFPVSSITTPNGNVYPLDEYLNSKIFVDGLRLSLGLAYNF